MKSRKLIVGTRSSPLALAQTRMFCEALALLDHPPAIKVLEMQTTGDRQLDWDLSKAAAAGGGKGLFTGELEIAMAQGRIDCAVHSVKDLPSELPDGFTLAALLPRGASGDVIVTMESGLLPTNAAFATGSPRRRQFLGHVAPGWTFADVRGNVGTRLRKLRENDSWHGLVLATAGLIRLGHTQPGSRVMECEGHAFYLTDAANYGLYPAPGQGIIGVECRSDSPALEWLSQLDDPPTRRAAECERSLLRVLACGCHAPVGVLTVEENGVLLVDARMFREGEDLPREARMAFRVKPGEVMDDATMRLQCGPLLVREGGV